MSIQSNLDALKSTLLRETNKNQPITVGQAIVLSDLLLELYGAIQSINLPTLDAVLEAGNTSDLGASIASITVGGTSALSSIGILGDEPVVTNGLVRLVIGGSVCKLSAEIS
jgi:branched-subunit amino acid transport protein